MVERGIKSQTEAGGRPKAVKGLFSFLAGCGTSKENQTLIGFCKNYCIYSKLDHAYGKNLKKLHSQNPILKSNVNSQNQKLNKTKYHNDLVEIGMDQKRNQMRRTRKENMKIFSPINNNLANRDLKSFKIKTPKYSGKTEFTNNIKFIETHTQLDIKLKDLGTF